MIALPEDLTTIQSAILSSHCVEFDYRSGRSDEASWRRVVAYGLVHGPITYLVGKLPDRDDPPLTFRLDQMTNVRVSGLMGYPPEDWDLDNWLAGSFGIWREAGFDIALRVQSWAVERAKAWRFHPAQIDEESGKGLLIHFHAGGLFELANHLFSWAGDLRIEAPEDLKTLMAERLELAQAILRPKLSQEGLMRPVMYQPVSFSTLHCRACQRETVAWCNGTTLIPQRAFSTIRTMHNV